MLRTMVEGMLSGMLDKVIIINNVTVFYITLTDILAYTHLQQIIFNQHLLCTFPVTVHLCVSHFICVHIATL